MTKRIIFKTYSKLTAKIRHATHFFIDINHTNFSSTQNQDTNQKHLIINDSTCFVPFIHASDIMLFHAKRGTRFGSIWPAAERFT